MLGQLGNACCARLSNDCCARLSNQCCTRLSTHCWARIRSCCCCRQSLQINFIVIVYCNCLHKCHLFLDILPHPLQFMQYCFAGPLVLSNLEMLDWHNIYKGVVSSYQIGLTLPSVAKTDPKINRSR